MNFFKNKELDMSSEQIKKQRMYIISYLLFALVLTLAFGTLEDPFIYTLSNIGNRFGWGPRILFIIWSVVSGSAIEISFIFIMRLTNYNDRKCRMFIGLTTASIIITSIIPALQNELPFWHTIHVGTSLLIGFFFLLAMLPFVKHLFTVIPEYKKLIYFWLIIIWPGSFTMLYFFSITAMFEIWFFVSIIMFLLYMTVILYESASEEKLKEDNKI
ncbi:MAG: hypothetical protein K9L64_00885 [Candidatus Izimaplasma sp.]|nr:hypothetical protein [Candidatus Izimaplasma bacterium]